LTPETTHQKQGFIHPTRIEGGLENAAINLILRDFDDQKLADLAVFLQKTIDKVMLKYPNSLAEMKITPQYRNMKQVLDQHPQVTKYAMAAIQRSGVTPRLSAIRGGTDGSRLSFMGMPCPNLFAGEQAIHSRHEWVSVQDMEKAVQTIVHLCMIWEENS
ncbi:MAG TPA: M20/M25/M40 family metallo-hydrolase, partial [Chitinophagales bacterium]|nr:M20/M25/M40 family metallo-hydrolase [Chitinophagales bacterium]